MKILTAFKTGPDLEALAESDWTPDEFRRVETRYVRTVWNPLDESALELTLKFRDQARAAGWPAQLEALTIGGEQADALARTLMALKFDRVRRFETPADLRFRPEAVAALIAAEARVDLIVMGGRSAEGHNAQTPLLAAEYLNWPAVTQVLAFAPRPGGLVEVTSRTDEGLLTQVIRPPCVLAVGDSPSTRLRVPTLKDRLGPGQRPLSIQPLPEPLPPMTALEWLRREKTGRRTKFIEGSGPEEKARRLYHDCLKAWLAE